MCFDGINNLLQAFGPHDFSCKTGSVFAHHALSANAGFATASFAFGKQVMAGFDVYAAVYRQNRTGYEGAAEATQQKAGTGNV